MQLKKYNKAYNSYFDAYLKYIKPDDDCFALLERNRDFVCNIFDGLNEQKMKYRYAQGKWNISQILQHIIDTERIFCYRALKIVREKEPKISSYNHEDYANCYEFVSKDVLIKDYYHNRNSSISLFKTFSKHQLNKSINDKHYKFKVGLIPFIFCGHELHHMQIIQYRYLS